MRSNSDAETVRGFGEEWSQFDQSDLRMVEQQSLFDRYFRVFPWETLPRDAAGFDMGCGSGRWARLVAPRVRLLICIDASEAALEVAKRSLKDQPNCEFRLASVDDLDLDDASMDFGYSLGVLHHIPDTAAGIRSCVQKLKPGAPFLLYVYYALENRPRWYRTVWRATDLVRRFVSRLPFKSRYLLTQGIAALVYYPLARFSLLLEKTGISVSGIPLSSYRKCSFYSMRTDALDRFGTRLEKRYTKNEIRSMMQAAGLERISFNNSSPYWCAIGYRSAISNDTRE